MALSWALSSSACCFTRNKHCRSALNFSSHASTPQRSSKLFGGSYLAHIAPLLVGRCERPVSCRRPVLRLSASAAATTAQLPRTPLSMVEQAAAAVKEALEAGKTRQQLVLLLPVNEKESNFMNTEPLDYPCSLQKEFDTAVSLTTSLLQRVLGASTRVNVKRIDDGGVEGEPCSVLFPDSRDFVAVVFPTAERLKQIQGYAKTEGRPLLIVNPQWNDSIQVISDFGFGPWKKAAEDFLATFERSYFLKEKRIGSPGTISTATGTRFNTGGVIRVRRQSPGPYESHAMAADGSSQLLGTSTAEPSYKELDALIKSGREKKLEIFEVAKAVTYLDFIEKEVDEAPVPDGVEAAADAGEEAEDPLAQLTNADIDTMDAATLRRRLTRLGQPTSGKISKLRERLRGARDSAAA